MDCRYRHSSDHLRVTFLNQRHIQSKFGSVIIPVSVDLRPMGTAGWTCVVIRRATWTFHRYLLNRTDWNSPERKKIRFKDLACLL